MKIQVIAAWPDSYKLVHVELDEGATVADAVRASGMDGLAGFSGYAVFGQRASSAARLQEGDRVELLRPLLLDPKEARRRRAGRPGQA